MTEPTITIGDEVIYPASNPRSRFLLRVIALDDDQPCHADVLLEIANR